MEDLNWKELEVLQEEVDIKVLLLGQSFRWKKSTTDSSEIVGVFGHRLWILKQNATHIQYKSYGGGDAEASKEYLDKLLYDYFQLDICLPSLYKRWAEQDEKFASLTLENYQGIRILGQDPIENIFSFICSSNNNIQRISQMVEKLCINYGQRITTYEGQEYFDFPKVEKLVGDKVENKLRDEKFGYRAGYIENTAKMIVENGGDEWVESLKSLSYAEARTQLQTLSGIGRKVADCICLMSLNFPEAIPIDTHIHQVAKEYLPHLSKVKTLNDKVYSEITEHFYKMYGSYAGWAQSVLFASKLKTDEDKSPVKKKKASAKRKHQ